MAAYTPLRDSAQFFRSPKVPLSWPSLPTVIPHRIRRKIRSTKSRMRSHTSPSSSITKLHTSFSPAQTIRSLRSHQWSFYDGQYLLLAVIGIFALSIIQVPGALVKTVVASLLITSLILPITRQFFLPILPIFGWLTLWFAAQFIPGDYRPPIWVKVLPALENIFYGANLSNILSAHQSTVLSVLAWLPYGLTHFGAPFVCSAIMFVFAPPGTVPLFARSFGYMNLLGVGIQLLFPCSPPWYENMYGLAPANYKMPGSPAGLAAIDKLLGVDMYTSSFTASPLVFGAFPSLHAGSAVMEALFMSHVFPKLKPLFIMYTLWLCWATMYLSHHYAVDLVGGGLLSFFVFFFAKSKFLPRLQEGKMFRWDYDYVERGEGADIDGDGYPYGDLSRTSTEMAEMYDIEARPLHSSDDEYDWSHGSTSSYEGREASPTPKSPIDNEDAERWEGETVAGASGDEKR